MFISAVLLSVFFALRRSEKHKENARSAFSFFLSMNSFILPMLTTLIFSTFPCKSFDDGKRLLMADLSIDCDSATHQAYLNYAKSMVAVYVRERTTPTRLPAACAAEHPVRLRTCAAEHVCG